MGGVHHLSSYNTNFNKHIFIIHCCWVFFHHLTSGMFSVFILAWGICCRFLLLNADQHVKETSWNTQTPNPDKTTNILLFINTDFSCGLQSFVQKICDLLKQHIIDQCRCLWQDQLQHFLLTPSMLEEERVISFRIMWHLKLCECFLNSGSWEETQPSPTDSDSTD